MRFIERARVFYEKKSRVLLIIPFLIVLLSVLQIGMHISSTGDFVSKGVSLTGGSTITFAYSESYSEDSLKSAINAELTGADVRFRTLGSAGRTSAFSLDTSMQDSAQLDELVGVLSSHTGLSTDEFSVEVVGSSLGESFFRQTITALIIAFLLMGLVVLVIFRALAPGLAVILAAASDIVVTLAVFNLTGNELSTAGIAAFLMLIGYSVDTDILLSTRVLRGEQGGFFSRVYDAMRTGLLMSLTTISAVTVALIFAQSEVIRQIMLILLIGLVVDLVMTWIQNVGILHYYYQRKQGRREKQ